MRTRFLINRTASPDGQSGGLKPPGRRCRALGRASRAASLSSNGLTQSWCARRAGILRRPGSSSSFFRPRVPPSPPPRFFSCGSERLPIMARHQSAPCSVVLCIYRWMCICVIIPPWVAKYFCFECAGSRKAGVRARGGQFSRCFSCSFWRNTQQTNFIITRGKSMSGRVATPAGWEMFGQGWRLRVGHFWEFEIWGEFPCKDWYMAGRGGTIVKDNISGKKLRSNQIRRQVQTIKL